MAVILFVVGLGLLIGIVLIWGFKTLPKEKWQMVAALPVEKMDQGRWRGVNLTWYGLLSANAYTFGVIMVVILALSCHCHNPVNGSIFFHFLDHPVDLRHHLRKR